MNFEVLENKEFYHFKEVASLTGVRPYVLRFWETEFSQISPKLDSLGEKIYSTKDLKTIEKIRDLLFNDKLSIPEVKKLMENENLISDSQVDNISGVEKRASIGSLLSSHHNQNQSSLEEFQTGLQKDLEMQRELVARKQFNDQDVLRLVQAKKKLKNVLARIDEIVIKNHW